MERIDKLENKILKLQNEIISLSQIEEELWSYHPDNSDRIDVKEGYEKIKDEVFELELKIDEVKEKIDIIKQEGDLSDNSWEGFSEKPSSK